MKRSKFIMLVSKKKRARTELPMSKQRLLANLLFAATFAAFIVAVLYILTRTFGFTVGFENLYYSIVLLVLFVVLGMVGYLAVDSGFRSTLYHLSRERRVIFIILLLGVLGYVDIWRHGFRVDQLLFHFGILVAIAQDLLLYDIARKMAVSIIPILVAVILFNIYMNTFAISDCEDNQLPWGIMGQNVSYCMARRLIYQSILSLLISACVTALRNRRDTLLFCNVNLYRSTGRGTRSSVDHSFIDRISEQISVREAPVEIQTIEVEAVEVRIREGGK